MPEGRRTGHFADWSGEPRIFFWTIGRHTGLARQKEWAPFAAAGDTLYLVDELGGTADWARNALASGTAEVALTVSAPREPVAVRLVDDEAEAAAARALLHRRFSYGNLRQDFIERSVVLAFDHVAG
jgi:hypothetical protein